MIHVRAMKVPRGNKHGPLYGYYASSGFGPPNAKEQIRRGVLLATVASVLVLVGSVLTWLVYAEVFGSKVPIMGPLVMTLGILLLVLAIRQFFIVWKQRKNPPTVDKKETAAAEDDDMPCDSMLEMETWDGEKPSYLQNSLQTTYYDQTAKVSDTINSDILKPACTFITTSTTTVIMPYSPPATQPALIPCTNPTTVQPYPTTVQPYSTTVQPYSTVKPYSTTVKPYSTTVQPYSTTVQPYSTTVKPYSTTVKPYSTTVQPYPTTVQPLQPPPPLSPTGGEASSDTTPKVKSCCDLSSMARSGSMEAPNPRPVIRYSQGQLELLDKEAAAIGRTSPTLVGSTPSHQSLGDRSTSPSPHERISHKSLSLSIEKTDILETI